MLSTGYDEVPLVGPQIRLGDFHAATRESLAACQSIPEAAQLQIIMGLRENSEIASGKGSIAVDTLHVVQWANQTPFKDDIRSDSASVCSVTQFGQLFPMHEENNDY